MTEYADLELCQELFERSGWKDTECSYGPDGMLPLTLCRDGYREGDTAPAYTCGYVLPKIPDVTLRWDSKRNEWEAFAPVRSRSRHCWDDNPANALVELAIELFKQEILTRGDEL